MDVEVGDSLGELQPILAGEALAPPLTGIGQYTRALATALVDEMGPTGLRIYDGKQLVPAAAFLRAAAARARRGAGLRRALRTLPGLYALRQRLRDRHFRRVAAGAALYHEPNFILKPFAGARVVTVHDLSHLAYPEFHPRERVRFLEHRLPDTLADAQRIVTVSRFSRDELVARLGVAAEKIAVTPLAAGEHFRPLDRDATAPVLLRHGLRWKAYILSAATFEPRKNLAGLITAFSRLPDALRRAFPLALAGASGWHARAWTPALERLLARGEARVLGYVADTELPALMSASRCLAYPSFYEGFGLPVLEAQACGTVVVTGDRSALPEIAAPSCLLVNPEDVEALTRALQRAADDAALAEAAREAGPRFAAAYSWRRTARETLAVYRAALRQ